MYKSTFYRSLFLVLITLFSVQGAFAQEGHAPDAHAGHNHDNEVTEENFDEAAAAHDGEHEEEAIGDIIMNHIADANEFHLVGHYSVPLPVMLYSFADGSFTTGLSSMFHHGEQVVNGFSINHHGSVIHTEGLQKASLFDIFNSDKSGLFLDMSITKNVFTMLVASVLMLLIFGSVASAYKKRKNQAPKGLQSFIEPIFQFVIDDIAKPNLGSRYEKYLPYLLTTFFFIWINNMLGLIPIFPGSANVTGNISVTFTLALYTLVIILTNANKDFWAHIFWMPGVPIPVKILLMPIELIGVFTKPFALMVRLFANISAGHIIILSLVSLIFMLGWVGSALAVPFGLFMNVMELLVAAIQAYIFTVLSAVFIGAAIEEHHHEEAHH